MKIIRELIQVSISGISVVEERSSFAICEVTLSDESVVKAAIFNELLNSDPDVESLVLSRNGKWILAKGKKVEVDW